MLPSYEVMQAIYTANAREQERRIRLLLGSTVFDGTQVWINPRLWPTDFDWR